MPVPLIAGGLWVGIQTFLFITVLPLVVRVLTGLGFGVVTYTGASFVVTEAETYIFTKFAGFPANVYTVLVMAGLDEALKIIFAAASATISIKVAMGLFTKWKTRPAVLRA